MTTFEKLYGVPEMSVKEEAALPENKKSTIRCKLSMVDQCKFIQQAADQIAFRARGIPIVDDDKHAELVRQMAALVKQAEALTWEAALYGVK